MSLGLMMLTLRSHLPAVGITKQSSTLDSLPGTSDILLARDRFGFKRRYVSAPGGRRVGARRSSGSTCLASGTQLTPLVPPDPETDRNGNSTYHESVWQTVTALPDFFVKIPEISSDSDYNHQAEFLLIDENENIIYETMLALPEQAGIVGLTVAKDDPNFPELEVDKLYYWEVTVVCNPLDWQNNPKAGSWVQRAEVSPELATEIQQASPQDIPALYAEAQAWYDTVAGLIWLYQENPSDATVVQNLEDLLRSVGQETISDTPLAGSATIIEDPLN
jgi:hypothetical protein